jgi:hypothetical protein
VQEALTRTTVSRRVVTAVHGRRANVFNMGMIPLIGQVSRNLLTARSDPHLLAHLDEVYVLFGYLTRASEMLEQIQHFGDRCDAGAVPGLALGAEGGGVVVGWGDEDRGHADVGGAGEFVGSAVADVEAVFWVDA